MYAGCRRLIAFYLQSQLIQIDFFIRFGFSFSSGTWRTRAAAACSWRWQWGDVCAMWCVKEVSSILSYLMDQKEIIYLLHTSVYLIFKHDVYLCMYLHMLELIHYWYLYQYVYAHVFAQYKYNYPYAYMPENVYKTTQTCTISARVRGRCWLSGPVDTSKS